MRPAVHWDASVSETTSPIVVGKEWTVHVGRWPRRGVVSGCGGGNYCATAAVTRGQMGVFISVTFGLTLYGP